MLQHLVPGIQELLEVCSVLELVPLLEVGNGQAHARAHSVETLFGVKAAEALLFWQVLRTAHAVFLLGHGEVAFGPDAGGKLG